MRYKIILDAFRKRCLLLAIFLQFIFSACEKNVLIEKPLDFLTPSNAYSTLAGVKQGVNGLYASVRLNWFAMQDNCTYTLFSLGTDESFDGEEPGGQRFITDYSTSLVSDNDEVKNMWKKNYTVIQQCNVFIDRLNTADVKIWPSEADKNIYLSEARFFRAFSYRILVAFFGDVPIVTEVINAVKTDFVRAPKADVYKLIEDDLLFAAANLPVRGKEAAPGRLTQGAAWHYLSEIYLSQGKFQSAVDAASAVINNYGHALMTTRFGANLGKDIFGSGDVYYDLFTNDNQNLTTNTEGVWVVQYEPMAIGGGSGAGGSTIAGQGGYYAEGIYGPRYFSVGKTPDGFTAMRGELIDGKYTGYSDTLGRGVARCRCTNYVAYDIWKSDWKNDIRNAKHNIKRNYYFDQPASVYNKKKIDFSLYPAGTRVPLKDTINYIYPYWMKLSEPLRHTNSLKTSGGGTSFKDIYGIRLAETLLLRAEAYLGLNNKAASAADINLIRNRAKATPVAEANVTIDYILDERARELYAEEHRYITLLRLGKLVERVTKYNSNPLRWGASIQSHNNLWPIPQTEIDLNINAVLTQNPGY